MKRWTLIVVAAQVCVGWSAVVLAQTAVSANGFVESTSGGFEFPDGTVQTSTAEGVHAPVEDTGQQTCWSSAGNPVPCSGTGQDGELQKGLDWPAPRFTDNGNGSVTGNLTRLVWMSDANCPGETKTWQGALDWIESSLNSGPTPCSDYRAGSFADWRLPNIKELESLVDYGQVNPALPLGHPFVNATGNAYWSSSTILRWEGLAWILQMRTGGQGDGGKSSKRSVWPVRAGQ